MALEEAIKFLEYAKSNADLDDKINQILSSNAGKIDKYSPIIPVAKEKGYRFTISELEEALLMPEREFDEDELLNVAGGLDSQLNDTNSKCKGIGWSMWFF